jgi:hypothetical protein
MDSKDRQLLYLQGEPFLCILMGAPFLVCENWCKTSIALMQGVVESQSPTELCLR